MKKSLATIISVILAMSLASCGSGPSAGSGTSSISLSGEINGEITVSAYDSMRLKTFLEDAAKLFMEKYPGTMVNVETASAMPEIKTSEQGNMKMSVVENVDDPQGRQDYINKVNTELMSGGGADVLAMDVLPAYKYIDSGQLENLAAYMDADPGFNRADYRENILDALTYDSGLWFMPLDYSFNYYAYDSTLLAGDTSSPYGLDSAFTAQQLIELAKPYFDGSCRLFNSNDYRMWSSLLDETYRSFVDVEKKSANFNDGAFASLLSSAKNYADEGYLDKSIASLDGMPETFTQGSVSSGDSVFVAGGDPAGIIGDISRERFYYKLNSIAGLLSVYTKGLSGMSMGVLYSGGSIAIDDDDQIAGIQANSEGSVPFTYGQAYGINSNSQNKETAWAFIKFLLSEEIQLQNGIATAATLPLLNSARAKKAEFPFNGFYGLSAQQEPQESLSDEQKEAIAQYNEAVERLSDQINTYVFQDSIVNDMISSETGYFFEGSKSPDEIASALQSKVDLYLNE